MDGSDILVLHH